MNTTLKLKRLEVEPVVPKELHNTQTIIMWAIHGFAFPPIDALLDLRLEFAKGLVEFADEPEAIGFLKMEMRAVDYLLGFYE